MAIGCSSNTVLHITAISYAAGCPINLEQIDAIGRKTPQICKLNPASQVFITDLDGVGGIQSMLKELDKGGMIHRDLPTVSGTVGERIDAAREADGEVIRHSGQPLPQGRRHRHSLRQSGPGGRRWSSRGRWRLP